MGRIRVGSGFGLRNWREDEPWKRESKREGLVRWKRKRGVNYICSNWFTG